MAINRGDILSRAFELPQPLQQASTAGRGSGAGGAPVMNSEYFGIPDAAEGLQWTDNTAELANRYYKRLAGLDQFAKSMWLNNKIDVTKADYSNPQSVAAAQAYQQELGNIMAIADELKQGASDLAKAREGERAGTFAINEQALQVPNKGYASFSPSEQGGFTGLTEPFQEAVKNFSGARETPGIKSADQAQFDARMQQWIDYANQLQATNPQQANDILQQVQRAQLAQNTYLNPPAVRSDYGQGTTQTIANTLGQIADVITGGAPGYRPTGRVNTQSGREWYEDRSNQLIGKRVFGDDFTPVATYTDGLTTIAVNDKGESRPLMRDDIDAYARSYFKNTYQDKEYERYIDEAARVGGLPRDPNTGTYHVPADRFATVVGNERLGGLVQSAAETRSMYEQYLPQLEKMGDEIVRGETTARSLVPWWAIDLFGQRREAKIPTSEGTAVLREQGTGKDKYIELTLVGADGKNKPILPEDTKNRTRAINKLPIKNGKELIKALKTYPTLDAFGTELMKNFVNPSEQGATTTFEQPSQSSTGKTINRSLIQSKVGTPGFEGYTEQELIDYYTSQGYTIK